MNSTGNTTVTSIDTVLEYQALYEAAVQRCRARRQQREARRRAEESRQEDERREWRREFIAAHRTLYANTGADQGQTGPSRTNPTPSQSQEHHGQHRDS